MIGDSLLCTLHLYQSIVQNIMDSSDQTGIVMCPIGHPANI